MNKMISLAGLSTVFFIMPVFYVILLLFHGNIDVLPQGKGNIDVLPVITLVAGIISLLSTGLLAKASKPGSAMQYVSILLCIDLALLILVTLLVMVGGKSFLSDPVSPIESAWIAFLTALVPIFTALVFSLPGPRSFVTYAVMVISVLVSAFTIFSIVMMFRDLIRASTIHTMIPLLWAYWTIEMPIIGICILSLALWYGRYAKQQ